MPVQLIDDALFEAVLRRAQASPRRRSNHNFHPSDQDNPHRFLNVFLKGSYVAPHRHLHPPKSETFLVLRGSMALFCFDDAGQVKDRFTMGQEAPTGHGAAGFQHAGLGIDLPPGLWHTVAALSETAVCFEVKPGPWDPATDKEFAPWAPREGDPEAAAYLNRLLPR
jgi:cupin fold WbuC family metalloprotein